MSGKFEEALGDVEIDPSIKEMLKKDAKKIMERGVEDPQVALKLACDKNSCGVKPKLKGKGILKRLRDARERTGIERISDPAERVDSQVGLLTLYIQNKDSFNKVPQGSGPFYDRDQFLENSETVKEKAKEIIDKYEETPNKGEIVQKYTIDGSGIQNYTIAGSAIYLASQLEDCPVAQEDIENAVGVTKNTLQKGYKILQDATEVED